MYVILSAFPSPLCVLSQTGLRHDIATDQCDLNYGASTLPILANELQNDQLRAWWTTYLGGTWTWQTTPLNFPWLGYQMEPGGRGLLVCWGRLLHHGVMRSESSGLWMPCVLWPGTQQGGAGSDSTAQQPAHTARCNSSSAAVHGLAVP